MKKSLFILFFLLAAVLAFTEELTGFMGIDFGTTREKVAKIMEAIGYKLVDESDTHTRYLNPEGVCYGFPARNILLSYSKDNIFYSVAFEVRLDKDLKGDALSALKFFQKTFNLQQQRVEKLGTILTTFYYIAPNNNRFIMGVSPDRVSFAFQHKYTKASQLRYIDAFELLEDIPKDIFVKEMQADKWETVDRSDTSYIFVKENGYFCGIWTHKVIAEFDNEKLSVLSIIYNQDAYSKVSFIDDIIHLISDNIVTLKEKNSTPKTVSYKFVTNNNITLTFTIPHFEESDLWTLTLSR